MEKILGAYETFLHALATFTVRTLEIVGISIVIFGSVNVLVRALKRVRNKDAEPQNAVIALGRNLALALEFKMGAEIVNTAIVRDLRELAVLVIVILIRALLAFIIHWEMKLERQDG